MTTALVPPRPSYHLRVFVVSLILVVFCLVGFLFGVRLEATVPATGVVVAGDQQEIRAPLTGLIELGWHDGTISQAKGNLWKVRMDNQGNGLTDPVRGESLAVHHYQLPGGQEVLPAEMKFHPLKAGDELWPNQVLAQVRADDLQLKLRKLKARLEDLESRGESGREILVEYNVLKERLDQAVIRVPKTKVPWLVLKVHSKPCQAVKAGDAIALIAPLDAARHQPRELMALLDIEEKYTGELQPGQAVRFYSTMYNQRLHGHADGSLLDLEPQAEPGPNGERLFRARAVIAHFPFPLRPGSSFKAEIVIGHKQVYRIILEQ